TEVELSLPLAVRGRLLGVMTVKHIVPAGARSDEEQLLKIVANQVAIAVENSRLYEGTVRRAAEAQSMVEAGRLLASTTDLDEGLHGLAELVHHRLESECVVRIWLRDAEHNEFRLHAQAGATLETPPERVRVSVGEGLIGSIIYHRTSVVVNDLRTDDRVRNPGRVRDEGPLSFPGVAPPPGGQPRRHPRAARLRRRRGAAGRGAGQLGVRGDLERATVGADAAALERDADVARGQPGGRLDPRRDGDRAPNDPRNGARSRRRYGWGVA